MALNAVSSSGTQSTTQNPQTSSSDSAGGTQSSSLQPGASASSVADSSNAPGVALGNSSPSLISLGSNTSSQTISNPPVPQHKVNHALIGFPVALFVLAVIMFWLTSHSAKITTE